MKLMVQNKEGGPWKADKGRMQSTRGWPLIGKEHLSQQQRGAFGN